MSFQITDIFMTVFLFVMLGFGLGAGVRLFDHFFGSRSIPLNIVFSDDRLPTKAEIFERLDADFAEGPPPLFFELKGIKFLAWYSGIYTDLKKVSRIKLLSYFKEWKTSRLSNTNGEGEYSEVIENPTPVPNTPAPTPKGVGDK